MVKQFGFIAIVGLAALLPATIARSQHHHDHHDGHGHGIGIHFGDHHDDDHGHGHDDGFGIHIGHDDHDDHGHHGHHSDWHHVLPHYDRHYHGTYYFDGGINYYVPQTYVTDPGAYVAAKPVPIEFGSYSHVDDLSGRLERLVNELCLDLHYNYRHNPGFGETYREAYQILNTAKYIHDKEHQGDRAEVARRLDEVDGLFHHVQDDIKGWSRRRRRQIRQGGAQTKLEVIEATLHHLMNDVGVKGAHGAADADSAPVETEVAPPPEAPSAAPVTIPPPTN